MLACMHSVRRSSPICFKPKSILVATGEISQMKYEILKCKNCKHQYSFPIPNQNDLDYLYSLGSSLVLGNGAQEHYSDPNLSASSTHWVVSDLNEVTPAALLEIGPGNGSLLRALRKLGWNCWGVDPGKYISDKQIVRSLQELPKGVCFDVVVFQDVLEHIADPLNYIEKVYNLTTKKSILYISTPYSQSLEARLLKGRWEMAKPFGHLHYFSKDSIRTILQKVNFEILNSFVVSYSPRKKVLFKGVLRKILSFPFQFKHRGILSNPYKEHWYKLFENIISLLSAGDQLYTKARRSS